MTANLYLHPEAFAYNGKDTREEVKQRLNSFVRDMKIIVFENSQDNKFNALPSLATTSVYEKETLIDFATSCLNGDEQCIFFTMFANTASEYENITLEELLPKCAYSPEEKDVNSVVFLNQNKMTDLTDPEDEGYISDEKKSIENDYITFDNYQIVYDKDSWYTLRRQILGNHPGTHEEFVKECRKYFPNICFHENCINSLEDDEYDYLKTSPRRIVYYLSCLNDHFVEIYKKHVQKGKDANSILKDFSGHFGLDKAGSIEENYKKKEELTFLFKDSNKDETLRKVVSVHCEPHLKIERKDSNYTKDVNTITFHPRIYFYFPQDEVEYGRIVVGSMGKHVS